MSIKEFTTLQWLNLFWLAVVMRRYWINLKERAEVCPIINQVLQWSIVFQKSHSAKLNDFNTRCIARLTSIIVSLGFLMRWKIRELLLAMGRRKLLPSSYWGMRSKTLVQILTSRIYRSLRNLLRKPFGLKLTDLKTLQKIRSVVFLLQIIMNRNTILERARYFYINDNKKSSFSIGLRYKELPSF